MYVFYFQIRFVHEVATHVALTLDRYSAKVPNRHETLRTQRIEEGTLHISLQSEILHIPQYRKRRSCP